MKFDRPGHPIIKMQIRFEPDIVTVRQKIRRLSELLGFDNQDQARLATAVSELTRNVFQYASSGTVETFFSEQLPQTLYVRVTDAGPGIAALDSILDGTYTSKSGMGVGLMGSKKLMDFFDIETGPDKGTRITIGKYLDRRNKAIKPEELPLIVDKLALKQADSPFEEIQNQNRDLLMALDEVRASREDLAELNRELAETNRGVVALYAELDEKAASLQKANEIKTSFLSNMTHEFRTPLSSVISLTRLLLDRVDGELSIEQERQVNYIRQSSEGLLELVNNLLDIAKVEAGKVSVVATKFTTEELLSGLRGMFRPILGNQSPIDLVVDWNANVAELETDQAKLSQILRNLVSNAIKFTEQGEISVTASLAENDFIHFKVTDSGIGVHADHLEAIFEDFSQVESKLQKSQKGTGLGLPLSRKLARLLGGNLWAESTPGKGSTFHVLIPRRYTGDAVGVLIAGKDPVMANAQAREAHSHFNVLLIDDDEPSRYVLKGLVSAEIDAMFTEATNGREGLEKIREQQPDLVFLDISMPGLDGFDVLKEIRHAQTNRDLPIVVNTAKKLSDDEFSYLSKEATAILSKERTDQQLAVRDLRRALIKAGFDYKSM